MVPNYIFVGFTEETLVCLEWVGSRVKVIVHVWVRVACLMFTSVEIYVFGDIRVR